MQIGVAGRPHCQMFQSDLAKGTGTANIRTVQYFAGGRGVMLGASAHSRLSVWKRRLLGTVVFGAFPLSGGLTLPEPAWGQASETLPEVTVTAPRPAPKPPRRAAPARAAPAAARPATPPAAPAPAPAALPAFQVV